MMKILLEQGARAYIMSKAEKTITINIVERLGGSWSNGCGTPNRQPSVRRGTPANIQVYEKIEIDGIDVYYSQSLSQVFTCITIKIEKLFFIKILAATGER